MDRAPIPQIKQNQQPRPQIQHNPANIVEVVPQQNVNHANQQSSSITNSIHTQIQNLLKLVIVACIICLILTAFSPLTLIIIGALLISILKFLSLKYAKLKRQGLIDKFSDKGKKFLLEKSIFDIYSDLLYFPLVTKIIGAFIRPAIAKPHPQQLHKSFQQLPENIQKVISTKGILSLAPPKIQALVLSQQHPKKLPQNFGKSQWEWYNYQVYDNHHQKVHEQTLGKKITQSIDQKISWGGFSILTGILLYGMYSMKPSRMKKMLIQNGCFSGVFIVTLIALVKIQKLRQRRNAQKKIELIEAVIMNKEE